MHRIILLLYLLPVFRFAQRQIPLKIRQRNMQAYHGYFDFYWDDSAGKIWLQINKFDSEFLYQTSLPSGLGSNDVGLDRGIMGHSYIVRFVRIGNKVLLVESNYGYRALTDNAAERRAVEESFAKSAIWGFTVTAESNGNILLDATSFLFRDALQVTKSFARQNREKYALDESRSAVYLPRTKIFH